MLPGRPSWPKNSGLARRALLRLMSSDVRPSRPTRGFASVTCIALAVCSTVSRARPSAVPHRTASHHIRNKQTQ